MLGTFAYRGDLGVQMAGRDTSQRSPCNGSVDLQLEGGTRTSALAAMRPPPGVV
jgi:hypothetical protein